MAETGFVTLVGAGPGCRDLFTLGGARALAEAEVVLYDHLAGPEILAMMPRDALKIDVGKESGNHTLPQGEINRLLLLHAQAGRRVVRLKGGDPYLFGRGAEELELLRSHGVPFAVLPGVTSAVAAPAFAGIPVTHRAFASSVHILTGHGKGGEAPKIDYAQLAALRGTLVFLMGVSSLEAICGGLLGAGMDPATPAALVQNGTLPAQRRLVGTLATLPAEAARAGIAPPAVLVVGEVCTLAEGMDFTHFMPLWGCAVLACSARATAGKLAAALRAQGAGVTELPCIEMRPLAGQDAVWNSMADYHWVVLTSAYGAELFFDELVRREMDVRALHNVKFAAIGPETARVLSARGVLPSYVPEVYNAEALAEGLAARVAKSERVLLYRAQEGTPALAEGLAKSGIVFDECAAYGTRYQTANAAPARQAFAAGGYRLVTFTSASSVRGFAACMEGLDLRGAEAVCIGESTAGAARALGMRVKVSPAATVEAMAEFILEEYGHGAG